MGGDPDMVAMTVNDPHLDEKLKPRMISKDERAQLMAFLKSLTPESQPFEKPQVP